MVHLGLPADLAPQLFAESGDSTSQSWVRESVSELGTIHRWPYGYGSIPIDTFLVGWTSIYQLFWGSPGTRVLTHPHIIIILIILIHYNDYNVYRKSDTMMEFTNMGFHISIPWYIRYTQTWDRIIIILIHGSWSLGDACQSTGFCIVILRISIVGYCGWLRNPAPPKGCLRPYK